MAYRVLVPHSFVTRRALLCRTRQSPLLTRRMGVRGVTLVCTRAKVGWVMTLDALAEALSTLPFLSQLEYPPQSLTHRQVSAHPHPPRVCSRHPQCRHPSLAGCKWACPCRRPRLTLRRLVTKPCRLLGPRLRGRANRSLKLGRLIRPRLSRTFLHLTRLRTTCYLLLRSKLKCSGLTCAQQFR